MGKNDGIERLNMLPQHLLPEIGTGIYHEAFAVYVNVDRASSTVYPEDHWTGKLHNDMQ